MNYLPDDILFNILSLLPTVDAIRTSSLSKSWKYLWKSIHSVDFNLDQLQFRFELPRDDPLENLVRKRKWKERELKPSTDYPVIGFLNEVHNILQCYGLQKVSLQLTIWNGPQSIFWIHIFNVWVCLAAANKVHEFDLRLGGAMQLPQCVFTNESLRVMKLTLNSSQLKLPETMALTRLKNMHLVSVEFFDENLTRQLFSGCPVLEDLVIKNCTYHRDFRLMEISSLSLKNLVVKVDSHVNLKCEFKFYAPQLKYFKYKGNAAKGYIVGELPSIKVASVCLFSPCKHEEDSREVLDRLHMVEVLKICCVHTKTLLPPSHIEFHRLRHLKLNLECFGMALAATFSLLNSSTKLETLVINFQNGGYACNKTYKCGCRKGVQPVLTRKRVGGKENSQQSSGELKLPSECRLKKLRRVEMRNLAGGLEVDFLKYLLRTQVLLEKVCISLTHVCPRNKLLVKELEEFPRASPSLSSLEFLYIL